jgi:hypothetical protein
MKSLIKKSWVIAMLFTAMVMVASNEDSGVKFTLVDSKLIDLKLQNSDGDILISVKDIDGHVLYSENYEGLNFSKKYDLATLPNGDYFFEIEGSTKIKLMPFKVSSKKVSFNNEIETVYYKPTVRQDKNLVYVSKVTFNEEASLAISLYDEKLNELYSEDLSGTLSLGKILDISKLAKGNYKLVLKSGNKVFTEEIKI